MNILLIGSGGREHTLAWKITQSPQCDKLFIAPGNGGTALHGSNLAIMPTDFEQLYEAVKAHDIRMLVVGPEEPLVKGIVDFFRLKEDMKGLVIIGPAKAAAQLEGSKSFAKEFMTRHHIPTAAYREFTEESFSRGSDYIRNHSLPVVLKADGLAAGKGVLICHSHAEALAEFELMLLRSKFGEAGKRVVVEEFLTGIEMSVFVLTNGKDYVLLPEAKDYKRIGEGDTGLNTGGMGAVSPLPFFDETLRRKVIDRIIEPTIKGVRSDGMDYLGFIFFGLMIKDGDPYMIEYNCRLGDPETEVVLPRLDNDLVDLFVSAASGRLALAETHINPRAAATIVAVSGGYPGEYQKGYPVSGLSPNPPEGCLVFHAGTSQDHQQILTNGGRVLAVTALADDIPRAARHALSAIRQLHFENMYFRSDIGYEFPQQTR